MDSKKEKNKTVFPKIYEKILPVIIVLMALTVILVMVFAAIVGLGII